MAREAYIAAVERGERSAEEAFMFNGLDRAKVRIVRRIPSASQVAEAA